MQVKGKKCPCAASKTVLSGAFPQWPLVELGLLLFPQSCEGLQRQGLRFQPLSCGIEMAQDEH